MPRHKTPAYQLGKITTTTHPTNPAMWQARGYYNDRNDKRQEVTAMGKTAPAAERALRQKVNTLRDEYRGGDELLRSDTKVAKAAQVWLDTKRREKKNGKPLAPETLRTYESYVRTKIEGSAIAELTLTKVNDVARIEEWLEAIADGNEGNETGGETAARQSRKVLSMILALAERRGAIPVSVISRVKLPGAKPGSYGDNKCSDPDCDYDCGKRHLDTRRAFTPDEAELVQAKADAAKSDIGDLVAFLFGTGVRLSEALHHTAWTDVDLEARTARVRGTKTAQADRVLKLSPELTDRLRNRAELYGTKGLVFGITYFTTKLGEPRDRANVTKRLKAVFEDAGVMWAGSHTFRRTVASWMDDAGKPLRVIANQLGHSDTNTTARYLGRKDAETGADDVMVLPSQRRARLKAV